MSTLDMQIMSNVAMLPDIYKQPVLDLILSLQKSIKTDRAEELQSGDVVHGRRKLGIAKGRKFVADDYDFDACNDEIAKMFGVSE